MSTTSSHTVTTTEGLSSPTAGKKRGASAAGLTTPASSSNSSNNPYRAVKRRASKACQCCRARKVRCNVVEHGAPCTNCRLDEVECIITESKRRKKIWGSKIENKDNAARPNGDMISPSASMDHGQNFQYNDRKYSTASSIAPDVPMFGGNQLPFINTSQPPLSTFELPKYIKSLPNKRPIEDLEYLHRKGAFSFPEEPLRTELLRAHFNFVHPYMPLIDKREFLQAIGSQDGKRGKVGLLLYQAIMFAGSAFVDIELLKRAGFTSRRSARRYFYNKARLLYDFDMETDRLTMIQAILLMTYWYETPDDQKDTWHWMGVAVSLAHTIGLHRNPDNSNMEPRRKKLWKRIWWSCVMRDRLVALGMRRPMRIRDNEDTEVPMLTLEDFEIDPEELNGSPLAQDFTVEEKKRYIEEQTQLAIMCVHKAKLCCIIAQVISAQYNVLNTNHGSIGADGSTRTTMLLLPKALDPNIAELDQCDDILSKWALELPEVARWKPLTGDEGEVNKILGLHRNLLHLVYCTTVSALHRPQVLPTPGRTRQSKDFHERSRSKVRQAAQQLSKLADELLEYDLVRYLPTTGVTVMLPAIIVHLLDIKSSNPAARDASMEGFGLCMLVMQGLRQIYAAADFACKFLEAAIRKADISIEENQIIREKILKRRRKSESRRRSSSSASRPSTLFSSAYNLNSRVVLTPPPDMPATTVTPSATLNPTAAGLPSDFVLENIKFDNFMASSVPQPAQQPDFISNTAYVTMPASGHQSTHNSPTLDTDLMSETYDSLLLISKDFDPFLGHWGMEGVSMSGNGVQAIDFLSIPESPLVLADSAAHLGGSPPPIRQAVNPTPPSSNPDLSMPRWPTQQFAEPNQNWLDVSVQERLGMRVKDNMSLPAQDNEVKDESMAQGFAMTMEDLVFVKEDEEGGEQVVPQTTKEEEQASATSTEEGRMEGVEVVHGEQVGIAI